MVASSLQASIKRIYYVTACTSTLCYVCRRRAVKRSSCSIFRSTSESRPNSIEGKMSVRPSVRTSVRTSVRPSVHKKFLQFEWKLVYRLRSMTAAGRYAVWPDRSSRSRSRALQSLNSFHFQNLSPPPFTTGAGKWPLLRKLGHNI